MTSPERHYIGEKGREYHEKKRAIPERAIPWVARLRAEKIQAFVRAGDTVFEFGAGFGWNLLELKCARKVAYDVAGFQTDAKTLIEWVSDVGQLPDQFAEVILCHHVLEHVTNPLETLQLFQRLLKPGGKVLLYVPFEKERRYRQFNPSEPNHHLFSWNVQTLGNLVSECGFKVVSAGVDRFGYDRFTAKLAVKLKLCEFGFRTFRSIAHLLRPASEVRVVAAKG